MRRASALSGVPAAVTLILSGCGAGSGSPASSGAGASTGSGSGASQTATHPGASASGGCQAVAAPAPKGPQHLSAPSLRLDPHRTYTVTVSTNCGSFAFTLDVRHSPKTSASIYALVKRGFYDGLTFHRVVPGFVIQGGDPLGNGSGGPGYTVVDAPPAGTHYVAGDVAMAKTGAQPAGASGSQFFVVTSSAGAAQLAPAYPLAGKVISGINVVQRIDRLPTNPPQDGSPSPAVVVSRVTVSVSGG